MNKTLKSARGFTLIEILVVIGIIAILATVVLIAINPARQFQQANDSQRVSNINTILNAIGQNIADNKGTFTCATDALPTTATDIGTGSGLIDLTCLIPTYLTDLPFDPVGGSAADTNYSVVASTTSGRITVSAVGQITNPISVSR